MKKNNNHKLSIIIIIVGILLIICGLIFIVTRTDISKDKKNNDEPVEIDNKEDEILTYNGLYQNGSIDVRVYKIDDFSSGVYSKKSTIKLNIVGENINISTYFDDIVDNKATSKNLDEEITIEFKKDEIILTGNDKLIEKKERNKNGIYKKIGEYSKEDYYNDFIGDSTLLSSNYSGKYSLNGITLYLYQTQIDEVRMFLIGNGNNSIGYLGTYFSLENEVLQEKYLNGKEISTEIKFDGNNLIFTSKDYPDLDGTYVKDGNILIDDIIAFP